MARFSGRGAGDGRQHPLAGGGRESDAGEHVGGQPFGQRHQGERGVARVECGGNATSVVTVAVVVAMHNLAIGVVVGSLTGLVIFAHRVVHPAQVTVCLDPDGKQVVYAVTGELFFASSKRFGLPVQLRQRSRRGGHRPE